MAIYRVEKDSISFYVQPETLGYYASEGYQIYKTVEEEVVDVAAEMDDAQTTVTIGGKDGAEL